jgi:hypothetical protein
MNGYGYVSVFSRNHCPLRQCHRFQIFSASTVRFQQESLSVFDINSQFKQDNGKDLANLLPHNRKESKDVREIPIESTLA